MWDGFDENPKSDFTQPSKILFGVHRWHQCTSIFDYFQKGTFDLKYPNEIKILDYRVPFDVLWKKYTDKRWNNLVLK